VSPASAASAAPGATSELSARDKHYLIGLALAIREARADCGMSAKELSLRSGVSERFVVELEAGRGNPSVLRLRDVAEALGCKPSEFVRSAEATGESPSRNDPHEREEPARRQGMVALLGLRGAGKSTVGAQAAQRVGVRFVELDERIRERAGLDTGAIFEIHGASYYRRIEREVLDELVAEPGPSIVATAGSLVTEHATFELLASHAVTVWLRASPEDHFARVLAQGDTRPMANRANAMNELRSLLRARRPLYERADHTIDTSRLGLARTIDRLERIARRAFAPGAPSPRSR
jgi:XRE family aerobic/anaerobic benzoate catabolism transcriptional regulator